MGKISKAMKVWRAAALAGCLACGFNAHAALVTVSGTDFDLTYDTTKLGLFGVPTLVGNSIFFTFSGFVAESLNGAGVVTQNSTISGLVLTARNGFQFGAFDLAEFGDYRLNGSDSAVQVNGQLRAFNVASAINTQTAANLALAPGTSLNLNDGALHDWAALARIDAATAAQWVPPVFGAPTNVIQSRAREVGITIENQLTAYTDASGTGLRQAFIEKKFAGVQMTVSPVPLPPSAALLAAGLTAAIWVVRRRRPD
jgi:hypothetical protein